MLSVFARLRSYSFFNFLKFYLTILTLHYCVFIFALFSAYCLLGTYWTHNLYILTFCYFKSECIIVYVLTCNSLCCNVCVLKNFYLMEAGSVMFEFYTALFDRVSNGCLLLRLKQRLCDFTYNRLIIFHPHSYLIIVTYCVSGSASNHYLKYVFRFY